MTEEDVAVESTSTRQPKWTDGELEALHASFKQWYSQDDPSQFFRMVWQIMPHRTLSGALAKIHEAQIKQLVPYYGALPVSNARERDKAAQDTIQYELNKWKKEQEEKKRKETKKGGDAEAGSLLQAINVQNELLSHLIAETINVRKFVAGIYRRAIGEDGKFLLTESMTFAGDTRRSQTNSDFDDNSQNLIGNEFDNERPLVYLHKDTSVTERE